MSRQVETDFTQLVYTCRIPHIVYITSTVKKNPAKIIETHCEITPLRWCLAKKLGEHYKEQNRMAEKANFIQLKARKSYFNVEIEYLLENSKLRQCRNYFIISASLL